MDFLLQEIRPGTVLTCRVTRLESFGAFVDIGCGIIAMLPVERISVSRIAHPAQRFREGDRILAAVWSVDRKTRRITMTHRELLGHLDGKRQPLHTGRNRPGNRAQHPGVWQLH